MTRDNRNIAARAGRWSAAHWKTATFGWLALVVDRRAARLAGRDEAADAMPSRATARPRAPSRSSRMRASSTRSARACSSSRARRTSDSPGIPQCSPGGDATLARRPEVDGAARAGRVEGRALDADRVRPEGPERRARTRVSVPVLAAVASVQRAHPGFRSRSSARPARIARSTTTIGTDFAHAEQLSVPLTFLILLLAFGAFVAAGLPVLLALSAVLGSVGVSALVSHVFHAAEHDELDDPADGHGRRGRLLALLREARARGASRGPLRRAMRCTVPPRPRAGGADLGHHRADRDGRHAAGRLQDLHLARARRDDRRLHVDGRLADRAAGAARQARGRIDRGVLAVLAAGLMRVLRCASHGRFGI